MEETTGLLLLVSRGLVSTHLGLGSGWTYLGGHDNFAVGPMFIKNVKI